MNKQYDTTWEGGGVFPKKYHISIEGTGTAEEILGTLVRLFVRMNDERLENKEWNNAQSIAGTNEYCYSDDGVLRTEVNEVENSEK